jgi:inner membrane protein
LNGSKHLWFIPLGKVTDVTISSNWATPSFSGDFLPDNREIADSGFDATWKVTHLNRSFPQVWKDQIYKVSNSAFGVDLIFPVDEYQASMRSAKYAILFIGLTFLIFIFIEILNKKKIHPVQYLLVSFGILIFYTLLIALSEHIGFSLAYLVSSIAIIGLITIYAFSVFRKVKLAMIMMISLITLYVFLFVTLQMEAYSLLMGSVGLFIILGIVMYLTRRINWYNPIE